MNPIERLIARFRRDRSGASAVEFALIVPMMLTIYFGAFEVTQGLALDRLVKLNASTVTNLVAQYTTISATRDMPDILGASAQILQPYSSSSATTIVSCVSMDAAGKATIAWSQALNGTARPSGQVVTVPTSLVKPNTVLILGETSMPFRSPIQFVPLGTWNLYGKSFMFPRASSTVNLTDPAVGCPAS